MKKTILARYGYGGETEIHNQNGKDMRENNGEELLPCQLCGKGENRFDESTYWTGMRSVVSKVTLRHWCESESTLPRRIVTIEAKTREACIELWNHRHPDPVKAELVEALEIAMAGGDYLPAERKQLVKVLAMAKKQAFKINERAD